VEARKEAYTWPSIFSRVWKNPGRRFTNLAYNILRKGPNDRLQAAGADEISYQSTTQDNCKENRCSKKSPGV
jgi:hypothetical protein